MPETADDIVPGSRSDVRMDWRVAIGVALALSLLFAGQNVAVLGFRQTYLFKLQSQAVTWGLWLALLPVVFAVAGRAHALPVKSWRRWTFEIGASIAVTLAHSAVAAATQWAIRPPARFGFVRAVEGLMSLGLPSDFLRYWFIGAVYHALAYHHEVRRRDNTEARLARTLAEARLENLEARLQPHFLFNALNTIAALIRKDPPAAATMVGQLSELLRAALSAEAGREVPLAGELRLLDQYVAIQRTRFPDRLSFSIHAPPDTLSAYVPQMILQPIVENSVRHGIGARETAGTVGVEAARHGSMLRLTVRDDGVGYGKAPVSLRGNGIGLRSTRARLTHHYGTDFAFDIQAMQPTGTVVTIDLPFHTQDARALRVGAP
jgi:two-component system, LytTR family, sensor kinase